MRQGARREKRPPRDRIIRRMQREAERCGIPLDLFWAKNDTAFQLIPPCNNREDRNKRLSDVYNRWVPDVNFQPQDLERYDTDWMAGIYLKNPQKMHLVLLQLGNVLAKIFWAQADGGQITAEQMHALCLSKFNTLPDCRKLDQRSYEYLLEDLLTFLQRYTDNNGMCRDSVRAFFRAHEADYRDVLETLCYKLPGGLEPREVSEHTAQEADAPPVSEEESSIQDKLPDQEPTDAERTKIRNTEPATNEPVPEEPGESLSALSRIEQRLTHLESTSNKIMLQLESLSQSHEDDFEEDTAGLCSFIEKTGSYLYRRSLSKLYALYRDIPEYISPKELELILRNFFAALRTLEIEPINEQRLEEEFPDDYREELARRSGKKHTLSACGWSFRDSIIIAPVFDPEKGE